MTLLLDTHVLIWYMADDAKLSDAIRAQIDNPLNDVLVSTISCWEIANKLGLGKLELDMHLEELLDLDAHGIRCRFSARS